MNPRPWRVTVVGWLYIAVGAIGFVSHWHDGVSVELVEAAAILAGAFVLLGQNWARWLAMLWIAFHVVLSAFHALGELAMHALFCAVIAWVLFRPEGARYFKRRSIRGDAAQDPTAPAGR
jgi:hypothetical protein